MDKEYMDITKKIGEFRNRHQNYFIKIDGVLYTWSELGSDVRFMEWLYGRYQLDNMGREYCQPFEEEVMMALRGGAVMIRDWIMDNYELPDNCDERTWNYLADKCAKAISFGSTFPQIVRYLDGELEYLATHPRGKDGKRKYREED